MQDERRDRCVGYGDVWKGCAKDHIWIVTAQRRISSGWIF
jgi:hypothetical protein